MKNVYQLTLSAKAAMERTVFLVFFAFGVLASGSECPLSGRRCSEDGGAVEVCGYDPPYTVDCGSGYCNDEDAACSYWLERSAASPYSFACGSSGTMPDPNDCSYYYECTADTDGTFTATTYQCPSGSYFDVCSSDCSSTNETACGTTYNCSGDSIAYDANPAMYYNCDNTTVTITLCSTGSVLENGACIVNETADTCRSGSSNTTTFNCTDRGYQADPNNCTVYYYCAEEGDTDPEVYYCGADQHYNSSVHSCTDGSCTEEFTCTTPGYFADSEDCASYYYCNGDLEVEHDTCPTGSYFDSDLQGCLTGTCTNDNSTASGNFSCTTPGFFADPDDCNSYYYCNGLLQVEHDTCPAGSYFDSGIQGCLTGSCTNLVARFAHAFVCPASGYFADPASCYTFFYCDSDYLPYRYACESGLRYDTSVSQCVLGKC